MTDRGVRPFTPEDLNAIVELRRRSFRQSRQPSPAALSQYLRRTFLEWPSADADLRSLVYHANGRVLGFLGVLPRRMLLNGEPLRMAVGTQFMVDPAAGPWAAFQLARVFLSGPQDLTLADAANAAATRFMELHGGFPAWPYRLTWERPLRPARYALRWLGGGRLAAAVRLAARPACAVIDAGLRLARPGTWPVTGRFEELDAPTLASGLSQMTAATVTSSTSSA